MNPERLYDLLVQGGVLTGNIYPADSSQVVSLLSLRGRSSKEKEKRIFWEQEKRLLSRAWSRAQMSSLLLK